MSQLCSILSKREDLVDFRPGVHNKLYTVDDTFDMRFGAFLGLKTALEKKKFECFASLFKIVAGYLCSERQANSMFGCVSKLRCTILSVGECIGNYSCNSNYILQALVLQTRITS